MYKKNFAQKIVANNLLVFFELIKNVNDKNLASKLVNDFDWRSSFCVNRYYLTDDSGSKYNKTVFIDFNNYPSPQLNSVLTKTDKDNSYDVTESNSYVTAIDFAQHPINALIANNEESILDMVFMNSDLFKNEFLFEKSSPFNFEDLNAFKQSVFVACIEGLNLNILKKYLNLFEEQDLNFFDKTKLIIHNVGNGFSFNEQKTILNGICQKPKNSVSEFLDFLINQSFTGISNKIHNPALFSIFKINFLSILMNRLADQGREELLIETIKYAGFVNIDNLANILINCETEAIDFILKNNIQVILNNFDKNKSNESGISLLRENGYHAYNGYTSDKYFSKHVKHYYGYMNESDFDNINLHLLSLTLNNIFSQKDYMDKNDFKKILTSIFENKFNFGVKNEQFFILKNIFAITETDTKNINKIINQLCENHQYARINKNNFCAHFLKHYIDAYYDSFDLQQNYDFKTHIRNIKNNFILHGNQLVSREILKIIQDISSDLVQPNKYNHSESSDYIKNKAPEINSYLTFYVKFLLKTKIPKTEIKKAISFLGEDFLSRLNAIIPTNSTTERLKIIYDNIYLSTTSKKTISPQKTKIINNKHL